MSGMLEHAGSKMHHQPDGKPLPAQGEGAAILRERGWSRTEEMDKRLFANDDGRVAIFLDELPREARSQARRRWISQGYPDLPSGALYALTEAVEVKISTTDGYTVSDPMTWAAAIAAASDDAKGRPEVLEVDIRLAESSAVLGLSGGFRLFHWRRRSS